MHEHVFEVRLLAVVHVCAQNEGLAREVVASALGSPSTEEVRLANEANFLMGREATIVAVNFSVDEVSAKLVETDGKVVNGCLLRCPINEPRDFPLSLPSVGVLAT